MSLDAPSHTVDPCQFTDSDRRAALVKRLNSVVLCLSRDSISAIDDSTIENIESEVCRIELLLNGKSRNTTQHDYDGGDERDSQSSVDSEYSILQDKCIPLDDSEVAMRSSSQLSCSKLLSEPGLTTTRASEIASAAEELASHLTASVQELQKRKEESEVLSPCLKQPY